MDKYEFISRLENALSSLSEDEKSSALNYYKELFEDAGGDKARELISNLGSPESIAESIIHESGMVGAAAEFSENFSEDYTSSQTESAPQNKEKKRSGTTVLLIAILLIVTFPLWIGFVIAAAAVLFALIVVAFALLFAVGIAGVVLFGTGITTVFTSVGVGILLLGLGTLILGLLIVLVVPLCKCVLKLCSWLVNGIVNFIRSVFCKREAVA